MKKKLIVCAMALVMMLAGCGKDSSDSREAKERTTYDIGTTQTTASQGTTEAATDSEKTTEATTNEAGSNSGSGKDKALEAVNHLAELFNKGGFVAVAEEIPNELYEEMYREIKGLVSEDTLKSFGITDSSKLLSVLKAMYSEDDNNIYTMKVSGDPIKTDLNKLYKDMADYYSKIYGEDYSEAMLKESAEEDGIDDILKDAEEIYLVPITTREEEGDGDVFEHQALDVAYIINGKAYSLEGTNGITPALIRYICKSAKADDVTCAGSIMTAMNTALANEEAYYEMDNMTGSGSGELVKAQDRNGNEIDCMIAAVFHKDGSLEMRGGIDPNGALAKELRDNVSQVVINYIGNGADRYTLAVSRDGQVFVFIGTENDETKWEIGPEIDEEYR